MAKNGHEDWPECYNFLVDMRQDLIQIKSSLSPAYDPHEEKSYNLAQAFLLLAKEIKSSTNHHEKTIPLKLVFPIILAMFLGFTGGASVETLTGWFSTLLK